MVAAGFLESRREPMNLKTLTLAALAALCAAPAVAAHGSATAGPHVTANVDLPVHCESIRVDAEDLLGPAFHTRTDAWTEDCEASASYHGYNYRARCAERSTKDLTWYDGPQVTLDGYCGVTVDA